MTTPAAATIRVTPRRDGGVAAGQASRASRPPGRDPPATSPGAGLPAPGSPEAEFPDGGRPGASPGPEPLGTVHPLALALGELLPLPDRHGRLQVLNQRPAGREGLVPVVS